MGDGFQSPEEAGRDARPSWDKDFPASGFNPLKKRGGTQVLQATLPELYGAVSIP